MAKPAFGQEENAMEISSVFFLGERGDVRDHISKWLAANIAKVRIVHSASWSSMGGSVSHEIWYCDRDDHDRADD